MKTGLPYIIGPGVLAFFLSAVLAGEAEFDSDRPVGPPKLEGVVSGFGFTEGPVVNEKGTVFFTDSPANRIYARTEKNELFLVRENSGAANGLAFDRKHRLLMCEQANHRVTALEDDGSVTVIADSFEGAKFNSPNDIVARSDGSIYFTDPNFGGPAHQRKNGVYRIDPSGKIERVIERHSAPNGIELSPDENTLYVGDSLSDTVWAYSLDPGGRIRDGRWFASARTPDGMAVDKHGNIYVAQYGHGSVAVFSPSGTALWTIQVPSRATSNCAFGPDGTKQWLYITAGNSLYRMGMEQQPVKTTSSDQ